MKKVLLLYWSATGNTKDCAYSIAEGFREAGCEVDLFKTDDAADVNFFDYDLIAMGAPSYNWHVPLPVDKFLKGKFQEYKAQGRVLPGAPKIGKDAVLFCTYSGPHTGIREAVPTVKYIGQFFEHFGFTVQDEWYILSKFVGSEENNTLGRMGDIRDLPNEGDLQRLKSAAVNLIRRL